MNDLDSQLGRLAAYLTPDPTFPGASERYPWVDLDRARALVDQLREDLK